MREICEMPASIPAVAIPDHAVTGPESGGRERTKQARGADAA